MNAKALLVALTVLVVFGCASQSERRARAIALLDALEVDHRAVYCGERLRGSGCSFEDEYCSAVTFSGTLIVLVCDNNGCQVVDTTPPQRKVVE